MTTLKTLARNVKLSFDCGCKLAWDKQDKCQQEANSYRCTLAYKRRRFSFDYWQGRGIEHDPDIVSVLDCLLSDARGGEASFEEFCAEFGYDTDSRKAEKIWQACVKYSKAMKRLLGDDYETFMQAERD